MKKFLLLSAALFSAFVLKAQDTYQFAQRDTLALYLDIYDSSPGAETVFEGKAKPAILFVFGGGFKTGARSDDFYQDWFKTLNDNGYAVVTIDYRLGMKGFKVKKGISGLLKASDQFRYSQQIAVEDVYSAVSFLAENREELGIDPDNLVIAGSSAGAITALAAEYDIVRGAARGLPEGFNFKGVMSFAGGIISGSGAPSFRKVPCPILLFHGTADGAVAYNKLAFFGKGIWGSSHLARKLDRAGANYCIYRFTDRTHDVAAYMHVLWPEEKEFLERNVIQGARRIIDAEVDDRSLPSWGNITTGDIY
ncbi:MAG: alpha/beta hydrolase [Bacteroidales bacterium]|nr:alpha/beta hydrolase [Bacteroidales bacterium]